MKVLEHPALGKIEYDETGEGWHGWIRLPFLSAYDAVGAEAESRPSGDDRDADLETREGTEEEQRFREGFFPVTIADQTGEGPTGAQDRAVTYLLENQEKVGRSVVDFIYAFYTTEIHSWRRGHKIVDREGNVVGREPAFLAEEMDDVAPKLDSPEGLQKLIRLGHVVVMEDVSRDGAAFVTLYFHCTWDEEHGYEVHVHKDQAVEEEEVTPFPFALPAGIDASAIPVEHDGNRHVELKIRGRWNGVYVVDRSMTCVELAGSGQSVGPWPHAADPEDIEGVRRATFLHRFWVSQGMIVVPLFLILLLGPLVGSHVISPVCLIVAFTGIPALFFASMVLCAIHLAVIYLSFRGQDEAILLYPPAYVALGQIVVAALGAYCAYTVDPTDPGGQFGLVRSIFGFLGAALGWGLWGLGCLAAVKAIAIGGRFVRRREGSSEYMGPPFFLFALLMIAGLAVTVATSFSKLHLLWMFPAALVVSACFWLAWSVPRWLKNVQDVSEEAGEVLEEDSPSDGAPNGA
jgi:hypothetical protein